MNNTQPPSYNMGVTLPSVKGSLNGYQIDWLSFTLPTGHLPRALKLLSDNFEFKSKDSGLYGYLFSMVAPGCSVFYSPSRPEIHVQLSGRGCDLFDTYTLPDDAKVTRLDIAFDSYDGNFTSEDVWNYMEDGKCAGTARTRSGIKTLGSKTEGRTIYIGSQKSDCRIRIYDKAAEQKIPLEQRENYSDWTRYEIQLRNDVAAATYKIICGKMRLPDVSENYALSSIFASFMRSSFFLCDTEQIAYSDQPNHHYVREPSIKWLSMFEKYPSRRPKPRRKSPTLNNLIRYVTGAAASIKALRCVLSDFDAMLEKKIEDAEFRIKHEELLIDHAPLHIDGIEAEIYHYNLPF